MSGKKKNRYTYILSMPVDNECDSNIQDTIVADDALTAYRKVIGICEQINKQYNQTYIIQNIIVEEC